MLQYQDEPVEPFGLIMELTMLSMIHSDTKWTTGWHVSKQPQNVTYLPHFTSDLGLSYCVCTNYVCNYVYNCNCSSNDTQCG